MDVSEKFWGWVDSYGGDYQLGRAIGKANGSVFANSRKRGSMPKPDTLRQIAERVPGFPAKEFVPGYSGRAEVVELSDSPDAPLLGQQSDPVAALQREILRLREELKQEKAESAEWKGKYEQQAGVFAEIALNFPKVSNRKTMGKDKIQNQLAADEVLKHETSHGMGVRFYAVEAKG